MKVLFVGDVVGSPGRAGLRRAMPGLRERHQPDLVIINGENSAGGLGITEKTGADLFAMGADVITLGNHAFRHRDAFGYGEVASNIDQRLVVDLRFFGYIKPIRENWVEYKKNMTDGFGMPQVSLSLGKTIRGAW